jgi:hypothetical protein
LGAIYNSRGKSQADHFCIRTFLAGGWVVAVGNENLGVMPCPRQNFRDFGMQQLMFEHNKPL